MAGLNLGTTNNIDVLGVDIRAIVGTVNDVTFSATSLKLIETRANYSVLSGHFSFGNPTNNLSSVTKDLSAITVVERGATAFSINGLHALKADVGSTGAFQSYLAEQSWTINGNNKDNQVSAGNLNDVLKGNGGNDILQGLNGRDSLLGGDGTDRLLGGLGNDRLNGGTGRDTLTGGAGIDTFIFVKGNQIDIITDFDAKGADHDIIDVSGCRGIDNLRDLSIRRIGADVEISIGADDIILKNVSVRDLDAGDFQF